MDREELLSLASDWLNDYEENIKPVLKTTLAYAPSDVSILLDHYANLTFYKLYYYTIAQEEQLSAAELKVQKGIDEAEMEINEILMEKEKELEELDEAPQEFLDEEEVYSNN